MMHKGKAGADLPSVCGRPTPKQSLTHAPIIINGLLTLVTLEINGQNACRLRCRKNVGLNQLVSSLRTPTGSTSNLS